MDQEAAPGSPRNPMPRLGPNLQVTIKPALTEVTSDSANASLFLRPAGTGTNFSSSPTPDCSSPFN